jgi:rsbT co-antagonist protein RsbR
MIADPPQTLDPTPQWTEAQTADVHRFWEVYDAHYEAIADALDERLATHPELGPLVRGMTDAQRAADQQASREALRAALVDGDWSSYLEILHAQGVGYAQQGLSFRAWYSVISAFRMVLGPFVLQERRDDLDRLSIARGVTFLTDIAMGEVGDAYLEAKQQTIRDQQEAIRELSTPVLQLQEGLLLLPLVGMIDTDRARRLTEALLEEISERRARVVVMDLTGVPIMDTAVANHLMQTVAAARLMGATALVTGISAENAQTLVRLGLDLSSINAIGDLMAGLEHADLLLHRKATAPA